MPDFGDAERRIAHLLSEGNTFILHGDNYTIVNSGKPTCRKGEPKTDIYVEAESTNGNLIEIKITYKKENADFIENKTNRERAEALLGSDWKDIIMQATESIRDVFENKKLIYKSGANRTEAGAITLGWKYELLNKSGGGLSGKVRLTRDQIIDVYAGTHISEDKRNASVNGRVIENCGIANAILMNDRVATTQEVIDNLYDIEEYVDMYPDVYFACKALNYRTFRRKYDGNRPLSVFVDWYAENGQLCHNLVFDLPLLVGGTEVADNLLDALNELNIETTDDITEDMVADPTIINY